MNFELLQVVNRATKIVNAINNHAHDGCEHCDNLLKDVYRRNSTKVKIKTKKSAGAVDMANHQHYYRRRVTATTRGLNSYDN